MTLIATLIAWYFGAAAIDANASDYIVETFAPAMYATGTVTVSHDFRKSGASFIGITFPCPPVVPADPETCFAGLRDGELVTGP